MTDTLRSINHFKLAKAIHTNTFEGRDVNTIRFRDLYDRPCAVKDALSVVLVFVTENGFVDERYFLDGAEFEENETRMLIALFSDPGAEAIVNREVFDM